MANLKEPRPHTRQSRSKKTLLLILIALTFVCGYFWVGHSPALAAPLASEAGALTLFQPFRLFSDPAYTTFERSALIVVLGIALVGLAYAAWLAREVSKADQGTPKMQ